jgi:hypothetical protein
VWISNTGPDIALQGSLEDDGAVGSYALNRRPRFHNFDNAKSKDRCRATRLKIYIGCPRNRDKVYLSRANCDSGLPRDLEKPSFAAHPFRPVSLSFHS